MSDGQFQQSTVFLKKAVPLMMKYKVPTTPTNYALWYTYVANTDPKLTADVDTTVHEHGTCSPLQSDILYQKHMADKHSQNIGSLKQSLESMMTELSHSMSDTLQDTDAFHSVLDKTFEQLSRVENEGLSIDETIAVVRNVVKDSQALTQSTRYFKHQLSDAQQEIAQLKQNLAEMTEQATHDGLTGLLNRAAFERELNAYTENAQTWPFALVLVDLDHFKQLNDTYGHVLGDIALKQVAKRLLDYCREGVQAFRYGGEEFALLLPKRRLNSAKRTAETLRAAIDRMVIKDRRRGQTLDHITVSMGVAEYDEHARESGADLIYRADQQLYNAKNLGRNRVMPIN
ncbi:GGDEF domain-containing protein [Salinivibrio sp. IB643]|jgi:diguanylate cyclase (GGDEF) domain|uniref:GGDEF domain-containing protein n=1 Tax=Salinivibrio sp. IB643 TaxID=1909445 RepID=UPI0009891C7A|nr:GGDEF domain-containing protein [Salinivibrio sp. IB643]OOE96239.1 GGDEF domain-containing protein [Salinivibrio sp. IB643]